MKRRTLFGFYSRLEASLDRASTLLLEWARWAYCRSRRYHEHTGEPGDSWIAESWGLSYIQTREAARLFGQQVTEGDKLGDTIHLPRIHPVGGKQP